MTIESPDLDFVYSDSDQYDAEIAGWLYVHIVILLTDMIGRCYVPSVQTENKSNHRLFSVHVDSLWLHIIFHTHGRKIDANVCYFPSGKENNMRLYAIFHQY